MNDIVNDIDELIDEQLAGGESAVQARAQEADRPCPHSGRAWHGLAITARLEEMRREYQRARFSGDGEYDYAESAILDGYRYSEDTSDVLCPGSNATREEADRIGVKPTLSGMLGRLGFMTEDTLRDVYTRGFFTYGWDAGGPVSPGRTPLLRLSEPRWLCRVVRRGDNVALASAGDGEAIHVTWSDWRTCYLTLERDQHGTFAHRVIAEDRSVMFLYVFTRDSVRSIDAWVEADPDDDEFRSRYLQEMRG
jgi:hypothetical protein